MYFSTFLTHIMNCWKLMPFFLTVFGMPIGARVHNDRRNLWNSRFVPLNQSSRHGISYGADDVVHVKLVLVGMRHGNRNPKQFLPHDPNFSRWGFEGQMQLTNYGKRQAYALGKALRERYKSLLPDQYHPSDLKTVSSGADRAQMSMQTFLTGLYPPVGRSVWNPSVPWQPIPVAINDPMLRMYEMQNCQTSIDTWALIDAETLPGLRAWVTRESRVVNYVSENTGWEGSLKKMSDVADNIRNLQLLNLSLPDWISRPTLHGFDSQNLVEKILEFQEARQIACTNHAPCRNVMAGVWLNELAERLKERKTTEKLPLKLAAYASHTEIVLSVMKLLNMDYNDLPSSAGFIIEYRDRPSSSVRVLYHEADSFNPDVRYIFPANMIKPCPNDWCPLQEFLKLLQPNSIPDWRLACRITDKCTASKGVGNQSTQVQPHSVAVVPGPGYKVINCTVERDTSHVNDCRDWAKHNYCNDVMPVRYLFCRRTCLCTNVVLKN